MNRNLMPKKKDILSYWAETLIDNYSKYWIDIFYDDCPEVEKICVCFACGSMVGAERCHIVSADKGGAHSADNIHLLCKECHIESELYDNYELYFEWFKMKNSSNSGSALRLLNKVKLVTHLLDCDRIDLLQFLPKGVNDLLLEHGYIVHKQ